jgi:hypothetical protein
MIPVVLTAKALVKMIRPRKMVNPLALLILKILKNLIKQMTRMQLRLKRKMTRKQLWLKRKMTKKLPMKNTRKLPMKNTRKLMRLLMRKLIKKKIRKKVNPLVLMSLQILKVKMTNKQL